jgi:hypothetical protein
MLILRACVRARSSCAARECGDTALLDLADGCWTLCSSGELAVSDVDGFSVVKSGIGMVNLSLLSFFLCCGGVLRGRGEGFLFPVVKVEVEVEREDAGVTVGN